MDTFTVERYPHYEVGIVTTEVLIYFRGHEKESEIYLGGNVLGHNSMARERVNPTAVL